MKIRGGPAAVTPTFLAAIKRNSFVDCFATVSSHRNGKAAKRAGKPEDLLMSIKNGTDGKGNPILCFEKNTESGFFMAPALN